MDEIKDWRSKQVKQQLKFIFQIVIQYEQILNRNWVEELAKEKVDRTMFNIKADKTLSNTKADKALVNNRKKNALYDVNCTSRCT